MIKTTIQEKVLKYLIKRKVAITQKRIADALNLPLKSVSNACKALKKKKLAGFQISWRAVFPARIYKVYWSYTEGGKELWQKTKKKKSLTKRKAQKKLLKRRKRIQRKRSKSPLSK